MAEFVPVRLLIMLALGNLTAASAIARTLALAIISASAGVANVEGMRDAATKWQELANQVELVKKDVGNAVANAKEGWIADDREAFLHAVDRYTTELDDLKTYMANAGQAVDKVHDVYKVLWTTLTAMSVALLSILLMLFALFFVPYVGPFARAAAEGIGTTAARAIDYMVKASAALLSSLSGLALASAAAGFAGFGVPEPTGGATGREDLEQITIDYKAPAIRVIPKRELPGPVTP
ncbi:WXG100 family type VII secretion target [Dactylosporangium sp. CS-047395]|uniref:WXG100 family type VII secretion target n=1 Tax=Dactylosporangium sp. CS-047395 TaxID=3239936 RepID=UPI003D8FC279